MPGQATVLGPFTGGLHNSSGTGEFIDDSELYELTNLEVDTDGSLANRPQIDLFSMSGLNTSGMVILGTYLPNDGRKFLVCFDAVATTVHLVNADTGVSASNTAIKASSCVQYNNKLFVPAQTGSANNGGYFDVPTPTTLSWTTVATMPKGDSCTIYKDRMWIAAGITATLDASRLYFSQERDPTLIWNSPPNSSYIDIVPGNGQKLVDLRRLGQDLVLFKEHSTHRLTYTTSPLKADQSEIDSNIGVPAINCVVVYNNNTVYVLHDNAVYELFQYTYSRITTNLDMVQATDLDLWAKDQYGLTLHRDRLFVRYFKNLYVYSLRVKRWSLWESVRKFSKVVVIPSATVGLDRAYAASASQALATQVYSFRDLRNVDDTGIVPPNPNLERFKGRIVTKTYDLDVPHAYKVLFWWGVSVATSGQIRGSVTVPNAARNLTYKELIDTYGTWLAARNAGIKWADIGTLFELTTVDPAMGRYARKFLKMMKKLRFRQAFFTIDFDIYSNGGIADAALRLYDLTIFVNQKQIVVKGTS